MPDDILWHNEEPVTELGIDVPSWLDQELSPNDVAAILQGGCASGAYMPAVEYFTARQVMSEHGDAVWSFLEDAGLTPLPDQGSVDVHGFSHFCTIVLSMAVEVWASQIEEPVRIRLQAKQVYEKAVADLGPELGGFSPVDLLLDNLEELDIEEAREILERFQISRDNLTKLSFEVPQVGATAPSTCANCGEPHWPYEGCRS